MLFVGVRCPVDVIMERRNADPDGYATGTPEVPVPPPALRWQEQVHDPGIYDLEVDTSMLSPDECAEAVRKRLVEVPAASAFERLAEY